MSTPYRLFVGIDISATQLSLACVRSGRQVAGVLSVGYTAAGMETLVEGLREREAELSHILVVLEATGNYWMRLALHLHQCGVAVSVINPAQGHYFAQALLQRGKSDPLDAKVLARLAMSLQPETWTPPPAVYEELRQRLVERDALLDMRQQVRNQRYALGHNPHIIASIGQRMDEHLRLLDTQIKQVEREIQRAVTQDATWAAAAQRLRTIPGVGLISAGWILVATVNFSQADTPEQVVAYAGLAPQPHQSGTSLKGRATIGHGGHARLRTALYMAALSAIRCNPILRTFYQRLLAQGKLKKVALCAVARKLLHLAWALVKHQTTFDPNYHLLPT
jgi:transposase